MLDAAASVVRVEHRATLTNQAPDVVGGGFINQRYFSEMPVLVVAEATNLAAAKDDGTPLPIRRQPSESPLFTIAMVDLVPDLFYPDSQTVTLTYDIPSLPPRSEGVTRVNPAFATFPVFTGGDPGLASVEVVVPSQFEVELIGGDLEESDREGAQVLSSGPIGDPEDFWVNVVARDDEKLVRRTVEVAGTTIEVQGWPGDTEWADLVAGDVAKGIPVLERLVGHDWPVEDDLVIVETVAPYLYGYGGWYQPLTSLIEIGDALDSEVILHELTHAWFNDQLFRGRWINEGLADTFTALTMAELGREPTPPEPVRADDPGRLRLNDWGDPDLDKGESADQERYGYNASYSVIHALATEIGTEKLTELVSTALDHELPYRSDLAPGRFTVVPDWRTVLDLFEEVGGATGVEPLFRDLVLDEADAALLDVRALARSRYHELAEAARGWAPALVLRNAMSLWEFDEVPELIEATQAALDQRDQIEDVLDAVDLTIPEALRETFEAAEDIGALRDSMTRALDASEVLRDAEEVHAAGPDLLERIGLLGRGVDRDLARAREALDEGAWSRAERRAGAVLAAYDGAATQGLIRLAGAIGLVALLVALARVRRRRRRDGPDGSDGSDGSGPAIDNAAGMPPEPVMPPQPSVPAEPPSVPAGRDPDPGPGSAPLG